MSRHRKTMPTVVAADGLTDVQVRGHLLAQSVAAGAARRYVITANTVWLVIKNGQIHEVSRVNSPTDAARIKYACDCVCFLNRHDCPHIIAEQVLRGEVCVRGAA